jgi:hypothetical protein
MLLRAIDEEIARYFKIEKTHALLISTAQHHHRCLLTASRKWNAVAAGHRFRSAHKEPNSATTLARSAASQCDGYGWRMCDT